MSTTIDQSAPPLARTRTDFDVNKVGILLFIFSEAVFFAALILSFVYYRATVPEVSGGAKQSLDIPLTSIFTLFLFASSFTVWRADKAVQQQNHGRLVIWLGATVVLGAIFLGGQAMEYARLLGDSVTVNRDLFGTTFFTLTGFHGFHVLVGLIMLSILFGFAVKGSFKGPKSSAVETISLYWHFVDVVWVFVYAVIYGWTLLS